ncbi:MAG: PEP/pyruvate-binding domain-containing protein [bacterium]
MSIAKFVKSLKNISQKDISIAGGKGASLGQMIQTNIPVPSGFVILASAFDEFLRETDINIEIDAIRKKINIKDMEGLEEGSEIIRDIILKKKFPEQLAKEIIIAFNKLGAKYVAVRSSATAEDSEIDAWAGQLETYLYITRNNLLKNIQKCWSSLYSPRALFYRTERGLDKKQVSVAVVIQKMIKSEIAGVCFTVHPVTQNKNQILIEACWGLGEALVQGVITPDNYVVDKKTFNLIDVNINSQEKQIIKGKRGVITIAVSKDKKQKQKLSKKQIKELAKLCIKIEKNYKKPQDIEWALEKGNFYITQSRPITTLK